MARFKKGQRVVLPANAEEGWKEERGEFVGYEKGNGMCIVSVDQKYRALRADDGLREVETKYIQAE